MSDVLHAAYALQTGKKYKHEVYPDDVNNA